MGLGFRSHPGQIVSRAPLWTVTLTAFCRPLPAYVPPRRYVCPSDAAEAPLAGMKLGTGSFGCECSIMDRQQFADLLLEALERELGAVRVYEAALRCAVNPNFGVQWQDDLYVAEAHARGLERVCRIVGIDPQLDTAGRRAIRQSADSSVAAMNDAIATGDVAVAQLAACSSVARVGVKDHAEWRWLDADDDALPALAARVLASRYRLVAEGCGATDDPPPAAVPASEPPRRPEARRTLLPPPSEAPFASEASPSRSGTFPVARFPRPAKIPAA